MTDSTVPRLPDRWPSAWPSLWRPVRDRAFFVGATTVLVLLGLARFGDLRLGWWVALLPLTLMIGPVTRPARVRRAIRRAAERRMLCVEVFADGMSVRTRRRTVTARVATDGTVTYCPD